MDVFDHLWGVNHTFLLGVRDRAKGARGAQFAPTLPSWFPLKKKKKKKDFNFVLIFQTQTSLFIFNSLNVVKVKKFFYVTIIALSPNHCVELHMLWFLD